MKPIYSIPKLEWHQSGPAGNRWADSAFGRIHIHRSIVHGLFVSWPTMALASSHYMQEMDEAEAWAQEKYESELANYLTHRGEVTA